MNTSDVDLDLKGKGTFDQTNKTVDYIKLIFIYSFVIRHQVPQTIINLTIN